MREIKFKAWDKKDRVMFHPSCIDGKSGEVIETVQHIEDGRVGTHEEPYHNEYVLMQYTGLKDKNGKELYEGDIVDCNGNKCLHSVIWKEAKPFGNMGQWDLSHMQPTGYYDWIGSEEEIIGNIYENPELLEINKDI